MLVGAGCFHSDWIRATSLMKKIKDYGFFFTTRSTEPVHLSDRKKKHPLYGAKEIESESQRRHDVTSNSYVSRSNLLF